MIDLTNGIITLDDGRVVISPETSLEELAQLGEHAVVSHDKKKRKTTVRFREPVISNGISARIVVRRHDRTGVFQTNVIVSLRDQWETSLFEASRKWLSGMIAGRQEPEPTEQPNGSTIVEQYPWGNILVGYAPDVPAVYRETGDIRIIYTPAHKKES